MSTSIPPRSDLEIADQIISIGEAEDALSRKRDWAVDSFRERLEELVKSLRQELIAAHQQPFA